MSEAGVTHGGFFKHFDSRDDLVAEALDAGFATATQWGGKMLDLDLAEEILREVRASVADGS